MDKREFLRLDDVISVDESEKVIVNYKTFKCQEFLNSILIKLFNNDLGKKWIFESVDCELLSPGKNWRKGKIKISLEFIPDEVDSPLDEIRREMQQDLEN